MRGKRNVAQPDTRAERQQRGNLLAAAAALAHAHAGAREALGAFWRRVSDAARFSPFQRGPLDVLLGESVQGERGWEDREWGGFALVAADGRRCILAVDRIGILVRDAGLLIRSAQ